MERCDELVDCCPFRRVDNVRQRLGWRLDLDLLDGRDVLWRASATGSTGGSATAPLAVRRPAPLAVRRPNHWQFGGQLGCRRLPKQRAHSSRASDALISAGRQRQFNLFGKANSIGTACGCSTAAGRHHLRSRESMVSTASPASCIQPIRLQRRIQPVPLQPRHIQPVRLQPPCSNQFGFSGVGNAAMMSGSAAASANRR